MGSKKREKKKKQAQTNESRQVFLLLLHLTSHANSRQSEAIPIWRGRVCMSHTVPVHSCRLNAN